MRILFGLNFKGKRKIKIFWIFMLVDMVLEIYKFVEFIIKCFDWVNE